MELRQLQHFVAVAEELNFSRAAKKLHLSQPPLTLSIQKLEQELGALLFYRGNRGVTLTEAGRLFHVDAHRILGDITRAKENLQLHQEGVFGSARVGFMAILAFLFLPFAIQEFRLKYPHIHLELSTSFPGQEFERLKQDQIDLNLGTYCEPDTLLDSTKFIESPLMACVPTSHPLARQDSIDIRQLKNEALLACSASGFPQLQKAMFGYCQKVGKFEPKIHRIIDDLPALITMVGAGAGITLLMGCIGKLSFAGIRMLPFHNKPPTFDLGAVWRRDRASPTLQALVAVTAKAAMEHLGEGG